MVGDVEALISRCNKTLSLLGDIDLTSPWTGAGAPPVVSDCDQVKGLLESLALTAARMDVVDSPAKQPEKLYGPGISKQRGITMAIDYVKEVRRWGMDLLAKANPPKVGCSEQPANTASAVKLPAEGTKVRAQDAPAAFREGGKPGAAVLTGPYLVKSTTWLLKGSYLTKHYGPGKELTTHIKVGRAKAYLYTELLVLRDRKHTNEDNREERR
jgi:hypothetical protein